MALSVNGLMWPLFWQHQQLSDQFCSSHLLTAQGWTAPAQIPRQNHIGTMAGSEPVRIWLKQFWLLLLSFKASQHCMAAQFSPVGKKLQDLFSGLFAFQSTRSLYQCPDRPALLRGGRVSCPRWWRPRGHSWRPLLLSSRLERMKGITVSNALPSSVPSFDFFREHSGILVPLCWLLLQNSLSNQRCLCFNYKKERNSIQPRLWGSR